jgi:alanyl aminopeptidase
MRRPDPAASYVAARLARVLLVLIVVLGAACAPAEEAPRAPSHESKRPLVVLHDAVAKNRVAPEEPAPAPRADGRLPETVVPLRYALAFDVDPRKSGFSGKTNVLVRVPRPTAIVVLHARDLKPTSISAETSSGHIAGTSKMRRAHGALEDDELVVRFDKPLPAGDATIAIAYDAPFGGSLSGLYKVADDGRSYAFTQFEATDARRAFPCFDEPSYKVPFDVTVRVPKPMIAVGNTPEIARRDLGDGVAFTFATTPPLPTYLLAIAVGELDVREGRKTPIPVRLVTTKGKAQLGKRAIEATETLVDQLGEYFGIPYPYAKLDIVAVPEFAAGAMENAGLITFREELLLLDDAHTSVRSRRSQAQVIAHELAHQWFGDLVTMTWWDDLWLNEGFATWMENKAVQRFRPSYGAELEAVNDAHGVMDTDSLASARRVRQPVTTLGDITESFDGLTYDKGAAVLHMLERFVGEKDFRTAVQAYLRAHAWGSAKASDLFSELDRVSSKNVTAIASSFLDQTGVPTVLVEKECRDGKWNATLTQFPWKPVGAPPPPVPLQQWTIPACLLSAGAKPSEKCVELASHATTLNAAPVAGRCPAWIHPNPGASGYYRFVLPEKDILPLMGSVDTIDLPSRIALVSNLWAMVRSGSAPVDTMLRALPALDRQKSAYLVDQEISILGTLGYSLVGEEQQPKFRAYTKARLEARKKDLGWTAQKPDEDEERGLSRRNVLQALAEQAEDDATIVEADKLALAWLKDPRSVDADTGPIALEIASRRGGEARFVALQAAVKSAKTPQDRIAALRGLGGFQSADLVRRALDWTLTDEVKVQDIRYVFHTALAHRGTRRVALEWTMAHWDAALKKLPGHLGRLLISAISGVCSREELAEVRAFYTKRAAAIEGAERPLAEALEGAGLCVDLRESVRPGLAKYFAR